MKFPRAKGIYYMARYFIGIPLPSEVKKKLKVQSWPALSRYKDEKLTHQVNWHITLAFIGDLDEDKAEEVQSLLQYFDWGKSFKITVRNFGAFPTMDNGRIIWMGCEKGSKELSELAEKLRRQLDDMGIPYDNKPFVPHITLARLRSPKNLSRLTENGKMKQEVPFEVTEIHLYDSEKEKHPYEIVGSVTLEKK